MSSNTSTNNDVDQKVKKRYKSEHLEKHRKLVLKRAQQKDKKLDRLINTEFNEKYKEFMILQDTYKQLNKALKMYKSSAIMLRNSSRNITNAFSVLLHYFKQEHKDIKKNDDDDINNNFEYNDEYDYPYQYITNKNDLLKRKEHLEIDLKWLDKNDEINQNKINKEILYIESLLQKDELFVEQQQNDDLDQKDDKILTHIICKKAKVIGQTYANFFDVKGLHLLTNKINSIENIMNNLNDDIKERYDILIDIDHYNYKLKKLDSLKLSKKNNERLIRNRKKQSEARHQYNMIEADLIERLTTFNKNRYHYIKPMLVTFLKQHIQIFNKSNMILQRMNNDDIQQLDQIEFTLKNIHVTTTSKHANFQDSILNKSTFDKPISSSKESSNVIKEANVIPKEDEQIDHEIHKHVRVHNSIASLDDIKVKESVPIINPPPSLTGKTITANPPPSLTGKKINVNVISSSSLEVQQVENVSINKDQQQSLQQQQQQHIPHNSHLDISTEELFIS